MTALLMLSALVVAVPGPDILPVESPTGPADLILHGGRVVTMLEPEPDPAPTALAGRDGRIIWVGDDASTLALRGPDTEVVDLEGAVAIPGLVDSHAHLYGLGKALAEIDVVGTRDAEQCADRVRDAAATVATGWLQGRGWDQNLWPGAAWPTRAQLDAAAPGRPVLLRRIDGHAAWASTEALRLAGIDAATPDPVGGSVLRDADGVPTGVLVDNAVDLVLAVVPQPDRTEIRRRILLAQQHCLRLGLVGVHEMGATWDRIEVYRDLEASGDLALRMNVYLEDDAETIDRGLAAGRYLSDDGMLRIAGIKLYCDGALGSRGALLLADYTDQPGHRGLQVSTTEHLSEVCRRAAAADFQVATHAIGDAANRLVLDIYEATASAKQRRRLRWRVEHAQILDPADLPRFAELGVIAAMQPVHCTSDMDWAGLRLGDDRLVGAYAWRSLVVSGALVCFGTDAPVESIDPLPGLYAARTRTHPDGTPAGGWRAGECVDARAALRLYTRAGGLAAGFDGEVGLLVPGAFADVTVLSGDPTQGAPARVLDLKPRLTIVHGVVRWRAD